MKSIQLHPPQLAGHLKHKLLHAVLVAKKCLLLMMLSQNKTNVATDEEEWGDGQDEDNEMSQ